jgi:hypothetical protein
VEKGQDERGIIATGKRHAPIGERSKHEKAEPLLGTTLRKGLRMFGQAVRHAP